METIVSFVAQNLTMILMVISAGMLIILLLVCMIMIRQAGIIKRYRSLMKGNDGLNLEEVLYAHIEELRAMKVRAAELEKHCNELDKICMSSIQRVGIVRFNAFDNTGSDLSFAVAMMDGKNNGVVLSSLFGRNESRIYAKPLIDAASSYMLTDEEKAAIERACGRK